MRDSGRVLPPGPVYLPSSSQQPAGQVAEDVEQPRVLRVRLLDPLALAVEDVGDRSAHAAARRSVARPGAGIDRLLLALLGQVVKDERGEQDQEAGRLPLVEAGPLADLGGHRRLVVAEDVAEDAAALGADRAAAEQGGEIAAGAV